MLLYITIDSHFLIHQDERYLNNNSSKASFSTFQYQ